MEGKTAHDRIDRPATLHTLAVLSRLGGLEAEAVRVGLGVYPSYYSRRTCSHTSTARRAIKWGVTVGMAPTLSILTLRRGFWSQ